MHQPIIVNSKPARRSYTKEFKADAVAQCARGDRSLAQVAMDLKINANLVRRWQKESHEEIGDARLLPVRVSHSPVPSQDTGHIEVSIGDLTIKLVGAVDNLRVAELIRALR